MRNERYLLFSLVLLHCVTRNNAFVPMTMRAQHGCRPFTSRRVRTSPRKSWMSSPLFARSDLQHESTTVVEKQHDDEPLLSELDARVLKSMLAEDKLELKQEENMRKLLERGVAPKTPDKPPTKQDLDDDGTYSSTLFKTLTSEKIWKSFKAKAGEVLETVQIFVANRVERDAKLLAAVGLFAWDRAKRDVARALPESGTSGAAVGRAMRRATRQLSNTSSFDDNYVGKQQVSMEDLNLYEELNTPMDEIRSVTQSILDILSGEDVNPRGRGLRTVAPAGQANNAERQRRAFKRRKDTVLKREKEGLDRKLGRAASGVADAAWEMKREMQVETNKPGYRTEGARKAIKAGAEQTAKVLQAATEERGGWKRILFGSPKNEKVLEIGATRVASIGATRVASIETLNDELLNERARVVASLRQCLEAPEETWLVPEILSGISDGDGPNEIDDDALREVVTSMICLRDDLEADNMAQKVDSEELIAELRLVKGSIESITSLAAVAAGYKAGESLGSVLYGEDQEPLLLKLDEIDVTSYSESVEQVAATEQVSTTEFTEPAPDAVDTNMWFASVDEPLNGHAQEVETVDVMEAVVDAVVVPEIVSTSVDAAVIEFNGDTAYHPEVQTQNVAVLEVDHGVNIDADAVGAFESLRAPMVELVSDEDFEEAFGAAKSTSVISEEELEVDENQEKKENFLVSITLRTLDAVVFVAEKLLTVGIPGIFTLGKTASSRFAQVNRDGLGYKGWKKHRNVQDGKRRY